MKSSKILALFLGLSLVIVLMGIAQHQHQEETVTCAVSGKTMKKSEAKAICEYKGNTYYFCCESCKEKFIKEPEKYLQKKAEMREVYTCPMHPEVISDKPGKCPECGMILEKKMMPMAHEHQPMMGEEKVCCELMAIIGSKEVEVKVENLKDGINLRITSKKADMAKEIQEKAAKMKETKGEETISSGKETNKGHCCK